MKMVFGIWTMLVALAVSVVAAYYSIVGLTAIFAAAVIPIIVMGVTLEVAKVTSAIWLHSFWDTAQILTKAYLTCAVVVLMFITSMGIFGFLSKAHIEQAANSGGLAAQIERIDDNVLRQQQIIERANLTIDGFGERVAEADTGIQGRIEAQERIIADTSSRLERDIAVQNDLIAQQSGNLVPLQQELDRINTQRAELSAAQSAGDVRALQALVGADVDGVLGNQTRQRIAEFGSALDSRQREILDRLDAAAETENPAVSAARAEINRLQQAANAEIARAQEAIQAFRTQLINVTTVDNTADIAAQEEIINGANDQITTLLDQKFELEGELRVLEAEVGPVRYIAELIYGETNKELLEQAVRWVIILLVLVFDPLAIVLVLAGLSILHNKQPIDKTPEIPHNEDKSEEPANIAQSEEGTDLLKETDEREPATDFSITAKEAAEKLSEAQKARYDSASPLDTKDANVRAPSQEQGLKAGPGEVIVKGHTFNRTPDEK